MRIMYRTIIMYYHDFVCNYLYLFIFKLLGLSVKCYIYILYMDIN